MLRFYLCLFALALSFFACNDPRGSLEQELTLAELRTVKGAVTVAAKGESPRSPYRRERLVSGQNVVIPAGALAWMRRDGGATWLLSGPGSFVLEEDGVKLDGGRAFVDTEQGEPVSIVTPQGNIELSGARASVEVAKGKVTAYVLRGSARSGASRANSGEMLTLKGAKVERSAVVSWQDWTGGLGTADPSAAPAPFGIGTVGARPPGDQGKPRSSLIIERLQVNVTIDRDLAFTEVDQTFVNPTSETVEGIFRFRTPQDAVLGQFGVDRDGKLVWGRVKESKSAQQTYESHVYEGSTEDPALLSWAAPGVYTARLYPIVGGAKRRVVTRYSEWLPRQGKNGERRVYVYPMAAEGAKSSLPLIEEMTIDINVERAGAKYIRSGMGGVREGNHVLVKEFDFVPRADLSVELFDDGAKHLTAYRAPHALVEEEVPEGMDENFAKEVSKSESDYVAIPLRVPADGSAGEGLDLAIVVDTSAATEPAALAIARSMAGSLLSHLGPKDRVALWAGDAGLRPVAPASGKLTALSDELRKKWLSGLASVERGGATDLGALLTQAANVLDPKRPGAVLYIGDGTPSVGEIAPQDLRQRLGRLPAHTRILPIAIGSQPNVALLDQVSRGAPVEVVEDAYGAARAALRILETVGRRAWVGAHVDLGPGVERVLPATLPPLSADETIMIVGRKTGKLPSKVILKGSQGTHSRDIRFERLEDRGDLRRRWGTHRLSGLLEEGAGRATLVDLSQRFGLVSPFTSLYVPTRAEEETEDYVDERESYEKREARLMRWRPWAKDSTLSRAPLGLAEEADPERMVLMKQYLDSSAESENKEGGTGTRAKGEDGSMGKDVNKRYAVRGPSDNALGDDKPAPPPPSADAPMEESAAEPSRTPSSVAATRPASGAVAPRPQPGDPLGGVDRDAAPSGNMWGDEIGDGFGSGGLGLADVGRGGGGHGDTTTGTGQGFGAGHGRLGGGHTTLAPQVRMGAATVSGKLPAEVVRRIVRQNFGRFRMCYEQGLAKDPNLEGQLTVRFVIGRDGSVFDVVSAGSNLANDGVKSCVVSSFYGLSFPQPEDGIVTVSYPLLLSPGGPNPDFGKPTTLSGKIVSSSEQTIGVIGHEPVPCGPGADLPLSERRSLWVERLSGGTVDLSLNVYRSALSRCEATNWRERVALLVLMVDSLPTVLDRVALWRALLAVSPSAADAVYRFLVLRVRTAEQLRQLHEALGFEQVDPDVLANLLDRAKDPRQRLTLLRGTAEKFPDDSELALRVLWAYEDAGDEAGGRAWARKLRARVDATSHLRTSVGEYYLRLAENASNPRSPSARYDEAEGRRTFGEIVEFAPEDPHARRHLGDLLSAHGWHAEALRQYETLQRLTPDDPTVHLLLARAAQGTGKTERAVRLTERAAATGAPDSDQPVTIAARALASVFLAEARAEAQKAEKKDELLRLRGRAGRLASSREGGGVRVILTWSHPELRPTLWTNALGSMMPSAHNLPLLGLAEAQVSPNPAPEIEVRLDPEDAAHAARLGLRAQLLVMVDEGEDDEVLLTRDLRFRTTEGDPPDRIRFKLEGKKLREVE